jgi:AraC family transcriptional regulator
MPTSSPILDFQLKPPPKLASNGRPWDGAVVHWHDWPAAGHIESPVLDHDVVAMRTSGVVRLTQQRDGITHSAIVGAGNFTLHPKGMESRWHWDGPGSIVVLRIPPGLLQEAAEIGLHGALPRTELLNCFGGPDPFVERIAAQFLSELRRPPHPVQAYISQALSHALALHLVYRFNCQGASLEPLPPGLSTRSLERVRDFIDAHLHEHIDLQMLATVASVSRFHFARLFKESAGMSAMAYLEQRRMSRAKELIRLGRLPLAQVASLVGYADQSYFTRRFRLVVGMTPAAFARANGNMERALQIPP